MDNITPTLIIMTVATLLPLLPAVLLFKVLPSHGTIKGPFKGMQVKFGGAFAGYVFVFLVLLQFLPKDFDHYHTWKVQGTFAYAHDQGDRDPNEAEISVRVKPPNLTVEDNGWFRWEIPVTEKNGKPQFPILYISLRDYQTLNVPLDPSDTSDIYGTLKFETKIDHKERLIKFPQPLLLQKSSYGEADALQLVSAKK